MRRKEGTFSNYSCLLHSSGHKHGKNSNSNDDDESQSGGEETETPKATKKAAIAASTTKDASAVRAQQAAKKEEEEPSDVVAIVAAATAATTTTTEEAKEVVVAPVIEPHSNGIADEPVITPPPPTPPIELPQSACKISAEREHRWNGLLEKRPPTKDGEAVSAWLMEVLSVSDLDTPLDESKAENPVAADGGLTSKSVTGTNVPDNSICTHKMVDGVVVNKKKRPLPKIAKREHADESSSSPLSKKDQSSFAEWKDRKKNKSLPAKERLDIK